MPPKPKVKKEVPPPAMKAEADSVPDGNEELQPCATILQKLMVLQDGGNHA